LSSSPEVAGVDFFRHGGLPVPQVTISEAERVAALLGLTVRAQPLGSQQDSNFLLADGGSVLGVLKIANPAFSAAEIEAQDAAAECVAQASDLRAGSPASSG
jgi:Ser/Thr protein kinase RdoA (MazF antagonist)